MRRFSAAANQSSVANNTLAPADADTTLDSGASNPLVVLDAAAALAKTEGGDSFLAGVVRTIDLGDDADGADAAGLAVATSFRTLASTVETDSLSSFASWP